ncbi:AAA+ family ATPase [Gymnodinialimonas ulvae]|uniref:AAA+ family ATPase n=1 Tax=Gymnodinialimonas ulvae TaxID=3126504 RepID=UPI0030A75CDD
MKQFIIASTLAGALAIAAPAAAQDEDDLSEGLGLLGEGAQMILEGLMEEMRPMLEEARPYFEEEVLPFLNRMGELMDDVTSYELPERLPNGDIIIRRSPDAPPFDPEVGAHGDVEL